MRIWEPTEDVLPQKMEFLMVSEAAFIPIAPPSPLGAELPLKVTLFNVALLVPPLKYPPPPLAPVLVELLVKVVFVNTTPAEIPWTSSPPPLPLEVLSLKVTFVRAAVLAVNRAPPPPPEPELLPLIVIFINVGLPVSLYNPPPRSFGKAAALAFPAVIVKPSNNAVLMVPEPVTT